MLDKVEAVVVVLWYFLCCSAVEALCSPPAGHTIIVVTLILGCCPVQSEGELTVEQIQQRAAQLQAAQQQQQQQVQQPQAPGKETFWQVRGAGGIAVCILPYGRVWCCMQGGIVAIGGGVKRWCANVAGWQGLAVGRTFV